MALNKERNREKMHEILDIVLDANDLEERQRKTTGNKPTVFYWFNGHMATLNISIHANGWSTDHPETTVGVDFDVDEDISDEKINMLRLILLAAKKED